MKNLKICFVQPSVYSLFNKNCRQTFGGAEVQVYQIGKYISENYNNIKISYLVGDFKQEKIEIYNDIEIYKGKSFLINDPKLVQLYKAFKIFFCLKNIKADIYIQRTATIGTGLVAFFCKLFKKKFIYMISHEIDVSGEFKRKNKFNGIIYEWGLKNADLIISQSEKQKELLKRNYNKKSVVIKSVYKIKEDIGFDDKKYVLWVGRCEKWKAPEKYLQLVKNNQDIKFIMIMPKSNSKFYDNSFKIIQKKTSKLKNLTFIEKVSFNEIDKYFKKAKMFINTSDYEGFPNTFIQAAKNKVPILSLNVNPDDFLNNNDCGFCVNDLEKMEKKIRELWNDKKIRERLGENAYRYAKNNHNIEKNAKMFVKTTCNLIGFDFK